MSLTVQPIRFTDNVEQMTRLLVALGLSVSLTSDKGGWVVLAGRTGSVALHSVSGATSGPRQGQTNLSFETDVLEELAGELTANGFGSADHPDESMVYDEAYGRAITITSGKDELTINGRSDDLYGYTSTGVTPGLEAGDLLVTPIRFVDDQRADRRLLEALGFAVVGEADEQFTRLSLPGTGGAVGLHPAGVQIRVVPGPFAVQLHFETATPLAEMIQRAESAGVAAELRESEFGAHVTITDADGQEIQVDSAMA